MVETVSLWNTLKTVKTNYIITALNGFSLRHTLPLVKTIFLFVFIDKTEGQN